MSKNKNHKQKRNNKKHAAPLSHNPLAEQLANSFVNLRHEVCYNLDSSRSKAALAVRTQREAEEIGIPPHIIEKLSTKKLQLAVDLVIESGELKGKLDGSLYNLERIRVEHQLAKDGRDCLIQIINNSDPNSPTIEGDRSALRQLVLDIRALQDAHRQAFSEVRKAEKAVKKNRQEYLNLVGSN